MSLKRALISVSDKAGIVEFAKELSSLGVEIISTGGTAKTLGDAGVDVISIDSVTGFPEIMDGRVKTLHPKIHGGLLGIRDNENHIKLAKDNNIEWIDLVVVNLYPFEATIAKEGVSIEDAIENIDIGGPTMIRSAAKNHKFVTVVVDPQDYSKVLSEIKESKDTKLETRQLLACKVFAHTADYDSMIDTYLSEKLIGEKKLRLKFADGESMRYGENSHQSAVFYKSEIKEACLANAKQHHGKELSYNNIVDADASLEAAKELMDTNGVVVIKHTNPCGIATGSTLDEAFEAAWSGDVVSSFGSVITVTRKVDLKTAQKLKGRFVEIILAPGYDDDALEFLKAKSKDLRILELPDMNVKSEKQAYKSVVGGMLAQNRDLLLFDKFETVTKAAFEDSKKALAEFAWKVCKHVKSNAIVLAYEYKAGCFMELGMGAGQPNRVDSIRKLAVTKATENIERMHKELEISKSLEEYKTEIFSQCVLASDAFFPFDDNIHVAASFGIKYIVEPGGSKRDDVVIKACDDNDIAMVFTGTRHFRH